MKKIPKLKKIDKNVYEYNGKRFEKMPICLDELFFNRASPRFTEKLKQNIVNFLEKEVKEERKHFFIERALGKPVIKMQTKNIPGGDLIVKIIYFSEPYDGSDDALIEIILANRKNKKLFLLRLLNSSDVCSPLNRKIEENIKYYTRHFIEEAKKVQKEMPLRRFYIIDDTKHLFKGIAKMSFYAACFYGLYILLFKTYV